MHSKVYGYMTDNEILSRFEAEKLHENPSMYSCISCGNKPMKTADNYK